MYEFKSIGVESNFYLDQCLSDCIEKKDYFVIKTPARPDYFWGNYILFKDLKYSYDEMISIFNDEIGAKHRAIALDGLSYKDSDFLGFKKNDFNLQYSHILICDDVKVPNKINENLVIQEYDLDLKVDDFIDCHFDLSWDYGDHHTQKIFLKEQALDFLKLIEQNKAQRYGAFFNGKLIADLGFYWNRNWARFNSVATHRDYRRQGACSTLVHHVSSYLLKKFNFLVMQADENYHVVEIYENVGFRKKELILTLQKKPT